jgi:hypothetical protein
VVSLSLTHVSPCPHALPHAPQFALLVFRSTQLSPHLVEPAPQTHFDPAAPGVPSQLSAPLQPSYSAIPAFGQHTWFSRPHGAQALLMQLWNCPPCVMSGQVESQLPQCAAEVAVSAQASRPSHIMTVPLGVQVLHAPFVQVWPLSQASPQPPQLKRSDWVFTQMTVIPGPQSS